MKNEILINLYYDKGTGKMVSCTRLQTSLLEKKPCVFYIYNSLSSAPQEIVPILRMLIFKRGAELIF